MLSRSIVNLVRPLVRTVPLRGTVRNAVIFQGDLAITVNSEKTPNAKSRKFSMQNEDNNDETMTVLPENYGTGVYMERQDKKEISRSPLAQHLFALEWVSSVFLGRDFLTVTKDINEPWRELTRDVEFAIRDFYLSGKPVIEDAPTASDTAILDTDSEVVATIKELMETRVRPSVQEDGGDIFYEGFDVDTGMVRVRLAGSCVGCPSSSVTLRNGVENMLMHYIPEVKGIIDVTALEPSSTSGESTTSGDMKLHFAPTDAPATAEAK